MNASTLPPGYAAEERAPDNRPVYCYVVQSEAGTMFYTSWDRPVSVADLPADMGASNPQVFSCAQITHGPVESKDSFDAQATTIQVTVDNDRLQRYFLTAMAVKLKAWIIRLMETGDFSARTYAVDAITVQSGILGRFGMKGNLIAVDVVPEPFFFEAKIPRYFFGRQCQHFVYGEQYQGVGCGLNKELFKFTSTIAALDPVQRTITLTGQKPDTAETYFNAGHMVNTTLGQTLAVAWSRFDGGNTVLKLNTWSPEFATGQAVNAYAGCQRTKTACAAFGNLANFGGFPYVPNKSPLQGIE